MMYGYGNSWWMMLMPLAWIIIVGLIIWAAVVLTRRPGDGFAPTQPRETPREILDRRLASGEINIEAYTKFREVIERQGGSGP